MIKLVNLFVPAPGAVPPCAWQGAGVYQGVCGGMWARLFLLSGDRSLRHIPPGPACLYLPIEYLLPIPDCIYTFLYLPTEYQPIQYLPITGSRPAKRHNRHNRRLRKFLAYAEI